MLVGLLPMNMKRVLISPAITVATVDRRSNEAIVRLYILVLDQ
jgi:hypothetical protein